jgi:RHS repeat-associated protein
MPERLPNQGGRVQTMSAGVGGDASILHLNYQYDGAGNILSIQDHKLGSPQTQTFTYDALDRLTTGLADGGIFASSNYNETYGYGASTGNLQSKAGVTYFYSDTLHAHAVTGLSNGNAYTYDQNGNMHTRRVDGVLTTLTHDAENRLVQATVNLTTTQTYSFVYDGDGQRVISTNGITSTVFIGAHFEWTGTVEGSLKYYYAGTARVAMRRGSSAPLFLVSDHLDSASRIVNEDGSLLASGGLQVYKPWGEIRYNQGEMLTRYQYTGQYREPALGLDYYNARWYDSYLGRFVEDTVIPQNQGTQAWDRYAGLNNNPVKFNDPTGHAVATDETGGCGPSCYMNLYDADNQDALDEALREYSRNNPLYNFLADPDLGDVGRFIYANAAFQAAAEDAAKGKTSLWDALAKGTAGVLAAIIIGGGSSGGPDAGGDSPTIAGKGNTGRVIPKTLNEKLAMEQVMSDPLNLGKAIDVKMTDPRWPGTDGWAKYSANVNGVEIHFNYNSVLGIFDDFKFK